MTNLVGFAGKRNSFRNETIENGAISGTKRMKDEMQGDIAQKITAKNEKRPFSK